MQNEKENQETIPATTAADHTTARMMAITICGSIIATIYLMSSCVKFSNEQITERQRIVDGTTNKVLEAYDVPIPR